MNRILQAILLIFFFSGPAFCQEADSMRFSVETSRDTLMQPLDSLFQTGTGNLILEDTVAVQPDFSHSASKAIMYALVLPGLGQGYNERYFKIPIVYAALGVAGYAIVFNTRQYQESSLNYALSPDDTNERYLRFWRRNLELSYIGLIVVYALQVVDAYVDAQLYSWDVNENLGFRIAPSIQPMMSLTSGTGQAYGLTCRFDLRRR